MSIDPQIPAADANYTGRYHAMPLRGRLTPYEGGAFGPAPGEISAENAKPAENSGVDNGFSFAGLLDMINPLQHIPVVSSLYRRITGDEITPMGRVAGNTLFFGVIGLAAALADTILEKATGKDAGGHVLTAMLGEKDKAAPAAPDDGAHNSLAAIAQPEPLRGRVTVNPRGVPAPVMLDAATLDALARTIGSAEPLAPLAAPFNTDTAICRPSISARQETAAAISYTDALIRMQQGLDHYQTPKP
ncbi:MAG: hypothetical protein ABL951_02520 [Alphaproteobacteria bacterium]